MNLMSFDRVLDLLLVGWTVSRVGFFRVFNQGEHSLCCNRIENRFDDTIIRFLHIWNIRHRDESTCLWVWNIFFGFYFLNFYLFLEKFTVFWGCHVRLTTVGALRIVVTIEAFVVFLTTPESFEFPFALAFTMSKSLTLKASHSIWNIWTDYNVVKAHAKGTRYSWEDECNQKGV